MYRAYSGGRVRNVPVGDTRYIWRRDPAEIGGLQARTFDELCDAFRLVVAEPDCCVEPIKRFVARHMHPYDGRACQRTAEVLRRMVR